MGWGSFEALAINRAHLAQNGETTMVTSVYAGLLALLFCWLSINVIKYRRLHQVSLGDGGFDDLIRARSAQGNAAEYLPIIIILLFLIGMSYM
mgnify:CR=1 FL=1